MISGLIFSALGAVIAVELGLHPGAPQTKVAGFGFAFVAIALGVVRVVQYLKVRSTIGPSPSK